MAQPHPRFDFEKSFAILAANAGGYSIQQQHPAETANERPDSFVKNFTNLNDLVAFLIDEKEVLEMVNGQG